jgi:hypothetical protein
MIRELLPFQAPNGLDSVCRIEVFRLQDGRYVVICEELDDNPGMSVSGAWEAVVDAVRQKYGVPVNETVWIEHNAEAFEAGGNTLGRWQLVTFKMPAQDHVHGKAEWRNMKEDDWRELGLEPRE